MLKALWQLKFVRHLRMLASACACYPDSVVTKTALVLGGTGDIGMAVSAELLSYGVQHVTLFSRCECRGRAAARRLEAAHGHGRASYVRCDLRCAAQTESALGHLPQVDICVNCVGAYNGRDWERELETNVMAAVRGTLLARELMSRNCRGGHGGCVVHICGTCGVEPLEGAPVLSAAKHACVGLCRSLGSHENEMASGVRVCALCPGVTAVAPGRAYDRISSTAAPGCQHLLEQHVRRARAQRPESCGKAVIYLIKHADSGSVWIVEGGQLFELHFPKRQSCSQLVCTYL